MPVPQNAKTIYGFLLGHGFSPNAAAGVLGNIEQESGGNPAAGSNPPGSGLIQQLGFPPSSLGPAMQGILTYISGPGGGSVADINAHASSPSEAALYFSNRYERPNAALANNANRMQSANDVAAAARSGNWPASAKLTTSTATETGFGIPNPFHFFDDITGFFKGLTGTAGALGGLAAAIFAIGKDLHTVLHGIEWLLVPSHWIRIICFAAGTLLLIPGLNNLRKAGQGDASLAMGILMVTAAGVFFFLAFHNIPDDVKNLQELLTWVAEGIRSGSSSATPASSPQSPSSSTKIKQGVQLA